MQIGTVLDFGRPMPVVGDEIAAWEQVGLSSVTLGDAYSLDAPTELGYPSARTGSVELVHATALIGNTDHIRRRLTAPHEAGVPLVNITPMATDAGERLDAVRTVAALAKEIS